MQIEPTPHAMHIFVCQNVREEGRASCGARWDGPEITSELKQLCKARNLAVRVTGTGCLGPCEKGPNVMVYPHKLWFHGLQRRDLPDIVDELERQLGVSSTSKLPPPAVD